jgi:hypothetical protein
MTGGKADRSGGLCVYPTVLRPVIVAERDYPGSNPHKRFVPRGGGSTKPYDKWHEHFQGIRTERNWIGGGDGALIDSV